MAKAKKTDINEYEDDDVVDVKFNVTLFLIKNEDGTYSPNDMKKGPLSLSNTLKDGLDFDQITVGQEFISDNMVYAGKTIKMKKKDADIYLKSTRKQSGFRSNTFVTDPADPRLYSEFPLAELVA
jgi:hypothetical protein